MLIGTPEIHKRIPDSMEDVCNVNRERYVERIPSGFSREISGVAVGGILRRKFPEESENIKLINMLYYPY